MSLDFSNNNKAETYGGKIWTGKSWFFQNTPGFFQLTTLRDQIYEAVPNLDFYDRKNPARKPKSELDFDLRAGFFRTGKIHRNQGSDWLSNKTTTVSPVSVNECLVWLGITTFTLAVVCLIVQWLCGLPCWYRQADVGTYCIVGFPSMCTMFYA